MPLISPLPIVATVHDVAWLRGAQAHAPAYARWYFGPFSGARWKGVRRVIVDSAFTRSELLSCVDLDPERVSVVHPGVDPAFAQVRRTGAKARTILCVGTVERRKNAAIVIEALPALPGARLLCAGPPTPYREECERLARRLGVSDRVEFLGYLEPSRLLELYASCTLAVAPSLYEGFGYAAAQALCAGIPLVAARSSSLVEVVGEDAALLDPGDSAAWARALAAILEAPWQFEPAASQRREAARARFSWIAAAGATAGIYQAAL